MIQWGIFVLATLIHTDQPVHTEQFWLMYPTEKLCMAGQVIVQRVAVDMINKDDGYDIHISRCKKIRSN